MTIPENVKSARELIENAPKYQIDQILQAFELTHAQYRRYYQDTPITPTLALDIIDAKDLDKLSNKEIARKWNLTRSQLNYALYNGDALNVHEQDFVKTRVEIALKRFSTTKTQTQIAKEQRVSQSYVHKVASELGLTPPRKKRVVLTEEQIREIKQAIDKGQQVESLAKQYKVSRDTIYKRLRSI